MSAKQPLPNQHDLLHPFYGTNNCCLCKAEQRIEQLEEEVEKLKRTIDVRKRKIQ